MLRNPINSGCSMFSGDFYFPCLYEFHIFLQLHYIYNEKPGYLKNLSHKILNILEELSHFLLPLSPVLLSFFYIYKKNYTAQYFLFCAGSLWWPFFFFPVTDTSSQSHTHIKHSQHTHTGPCHLVMQVQVLSGTRWGCHTPGRGCHTHVWHDAPVLAPLAACASKWHQGLVTEPSSTPASALVSGLCRLPEQLRLATPRWAACCSPVTITLARAAQKEEPGVLLLPPSSDFWVLFLTSCLSLLDSNDSPSGTAISLFVKRRETFIFIPSQHTILQTDETMKLWLAKIITALQGHVIHRCHTIKWFSPGPSSSKLEAASAR